MVPPWWAAELHHTVLTLPLLKGRVGKNMMKSWRIEIRTLSSLEKQSQHREINVIYYLLLTDWRTECKPKSLSHHLLSSTFFLSDAGNRELGCSQQPIMLHLCHSFMATLLLLHVGSLPLDTILPRLIAPGHPIGCSFSSPSAPPQAAAFRPHPFLHCCSTWCQWVAGDSLLLHGPLLGCREIFLCLELSSCPLSLILVPAELLLSHSYCCTAVFPS